MLDSIINDMTSEFGKEKLLRGFLLFSVNAGTFFGLNILYFILSNIPSLRRYKVQPEQESKLVDWITCAKLVAFNYLCIILPLMVASSYLKGESRPWPVWYRAIIEIILAAMLDDFLLYWVHRLSHWPSVYWIHKAHHEYTAPFGLESAYMHPIEVVLVAACSGAGGFLIMTSVYQIIPLLFYRAFLNVEHHCGYAYPWNRIRKFWPISTSMHFFKLWFSTKVDVRKHVLNVFGGTPFIRSDNFVLSLSHLKSIDLVLNSLTILPCA